MSRLTEHVKTLLKLDAFALGIMHISNRYLGSVAAGKNMLKPGNGKYFRWKHGEVFYHKYGKGSPIVLLHHLDPAFSSYEWNEIVDDLATDHTVYTVDLPGCGRSTKKNDSYSNYYYVLFLTAFIKELVKSRCTVIASGYSSSFAIMTASVDCKLIDRIIAVNPKNVRELNRLPDSRSRAASVLISLPIIGTTLYNIVQSRDNIDLRFSEEYLYNPFRSKDRFVDAFYEGAHFHEDGGKYLLASVQGRILAVNIIEALRKVGDRLMILYGDKAEKSDSVISAYRKYNDSIVAYPVSGTRLVPHMERPQEFLSVCGSFLKENDAEV